MHIKGIITIPSINEFGKLVPERFGISRLGWATPIGRGLGGGGPFETFC